jgi:hypothetical protein
MQENQNQILDNVLSGLKDLDKLIDNIKYKEVSNIGITRKGYDFIKSASLFLQDNLTRLKDS